jgi:chitodextrinase
MKNVKCFFMCLLIINIFIPICQNDCSYAAGDDLLFIHHSVGLNWLNDELRTVLDGKSYVDEVNESDYGTAVSATAGRTASLGSAPGDSTDLCHWLFWFNDYLAGMKQLGCADGTNRIIMFKSCFPNSEIVSNGAEPGNPFSEERTLANYRAVFRHPSGSRYTYTYGGYSYYALEDIFAANPNTLFIYVTASPSQWLDNAGRARAFNNWVKGEWLTNYNTAHPTLHNVAVFDYFNILADPATNTLRPMYDQGDGHPNAAGNAVATPAFSTFIDSAWTTFNVGAPGDITAPTVPASLSATAVSSTQINLSWTASTDNVGVTGYRVYRGGTQIATTTGTSYSNTGLTPSTTYSYTVAAYDAAGNISAQSAVARATTSAVVSPDSRTVGTSAELNTAVNDANSGVINEILLRDGTYTLTGALQIRRSGITIRSLSGTRGAVIVQGQGMSGSIGYGFQIHTGVNGFTIRDLTLRRFAYHAIQLYPNVDNVTIRNIIFNDTGEQMVKGTYDAGVTNPSENILVENCVFEYTAGTGPQYYIGGVDCHFHHNGIVRNCAFKNIRSPSDDVAEHAVHFWTSSNNTLVERNTIVNCDRGIGFGLEDRRHRNGIIRNNFIYNNGTGSFCDVGIDLHIESGSSAQVYNNTVLVNSYPNAIEYWSTTGLSTVIVNNLTNNAIASRSGGNASLRNNVTTAANGWFINPTVGNLHLASAKTEVVNRGEAVSGLTVDIDGDTRPFGSGIDIGADEYTGSVPGGDTTPPSVPAGLSATAVSSTQINLTWTASTDNVGVTGYRIYRGGVQIGTITGTSCSNTGLTPSTTYTYTVAAYDAAGNISAQSVSASATTRSAGGGSGGLLYPSDLEYLGAFRLPDGTSETATWAWGGTEMTYYPDGNPTGPNDGYSGSIFGVGHDWDQYISEISIPAPVNSRNLSLLNTAGTLQGFRNIRGSISFSPGEEGFRTGIEYLPAQGNQASGKLYFCEGMHFQEGSTGPTHAWCELDLAHPNAVGAWEIGGLLNYVTADYIFEIPQDWAAANTPGLFLATGRYRDGGQGARGPSIVAYGPWNHGNSPAAGTRLNAIPLLLYTDVLSPDNHTLNNYAHSDEWVGGAWLTSGSNSSVIIVGTKGIGSCWYGFSDGTLWPNPTNTEGPGERGWWSSSFQGQILFYRPSDLAAVAHGAPSYQPQPYAVMNIDSNLLHITSTQQKGHVCSVCFDRARGYLYVMEPFADGEKPIVHVWKVNGGSSDPNPDPDPDPTPDPADPGNVAYHCRVTASSYYNTDYNPNMAVDGRIGAWDSNEWASCGEMTPWIRFNLDRSQLVNKVVLYDRSNPVDHIKDAWLYLNRGGNRVRSIHLGMFPYGGSAKEVVFDEVEIDEMLLVITEGVGLNIGLSELKAYYDANIINEVDNLALECTVMASSSYNENYSPELAVDGKFGVWDSYEWASRGEMTPWIRFHLDRSQPINKVVLYDRSNPVDHIRDAWLFLNNGGNRVRSIHLGMFPYGGSAKEVVFDETEADEILLVVTDGVGLNIGLSEFKAYYDVNAINDLDNLALGCSVEAVNYYDESYIPELAVDGRFGVWDSYEWASCGEMTPWIRFYLNSPQLINKVVLYDRSNPVDHIRDAWLHFNNGGYRVRSIHLGMFPYGGSAKEVVFDETEADEIELVVTDGEGLNIGLSELKAYLDN